MLPLGSAALAVSGAQEPRILAQAMAEYLGLSVRHYDSTESGGSS